MLILDGSETLDVTLSILIRRQWGFDQRRWPLGGSSKGNMTSYQLLGRWRQVPGAEEFEYQTLELSSLLGHHLGVSLAHPLTSNHWSYLLASLNSIQ